MVSKLKCLTIDSQMLVEKGRLQRENVHLILFNLCKSQIVAVSSYFIHFLGISLRYVLFPGKSFDKLRQLGLICIALGLFVAERRVPLEQIHCPRTARSV